MSWFTENFYTLMIVLGFGLLVLEVAVFGFSVFILFFIGLACIVTGALIGIGVLPASIVAACAGVAVLTVAFAVMLWKPLKKMQNSGITHEVKGDFIGHSFVLAGAVSPKQFCSHRMSGVDWQVRANTAITAGTLVEVVKVEVGELTVAAK